MINIILKFNDLYTSTMISDVLDLVQAKSVVQYERTEFLVKVTPDMLSRLRKIKSITTEVIKESLWKLNHL